MAPRFRGTRSEIISGAQDYVASKVDCMPEDVADFAWEATTKKRVGIGMTIVCPSKKIFFSQALEDLSKCTLTFLARFLCCIDPK